MNRGATKDTTVNRMSREALGLRTWFRTLPLCPFLESSGAVRVLDGYDTDEHKIQKRNGTFS